MSQHMWSCTAARVSTEGHRLEVFTVFHLKACLLVHEATTMRLQ